MRPATTRAPVVRYRADMSRVETVDAPPALPSPRNGPTHWHLDAADPRGGGGPAPAAGVLRHPLAGVRRRRVRVVGAGHARRRGALPRHLLEPGAGVPPPAVGRRPGRPAHPRRTAGVGGRRRGAAHRSRCTRRAPTLTTRPNALLAAGLVTTSGSILWVTGPVNADGPSLALSVLAVAFALRYRDDPRLRNTVWVGLAAGGAVSIKALSVPAVVIAGLIVLLSHRPLRQGVRDAAVAAGIALGVYVVAALPFGLGRVWDQSYVVPPGLEPRRTRTGAPYARSSTPCGTAISSCCSRSRWPRSRSRCASWPGAAPASAGRPGAHDRRRRPRPLDRARVRAARLGAGDVARPRRPPRPPARAAGGVGPAPWKVLAVAFVVAARVLRVEQPVDPVARRLLRDRGRIGAATRAASRPTRW